MTRIMAAHQPLFLPYLGYFERIKRCDVFVIRDDTLFAKRNFHHRNRIRVPGPEVKLKWLTVPVDKSTIPLHQVKIKNEVRTKGRSWNQDLLFQIQGCYASAPYYGDYYPRIAEILSTTHETLAGLTMSLIRQFCQWFGLQTEIVLATELPDFQPTGDATLDLVELTKCAGCDTYMSGDGARIYIRQEPFEEADLGFVFQEYKHPTYTQGELEFVPYVACIDAFFHCGPEASKLL